MIRRGALIALFVLASACGPAQTLHVADVQLGRSLNADSTVADYAAAFTPHEKIYVSVITAGKGRGTIGVRWLLAGRLLDEPKKQVSSAGPRAASFALESGSGFPEGDYAVEVFLDGRPAGSRTFKVAARR
jgi:hypothetical protein